MNDFVPALLKEMEWRAHYLDAAIEGQANHPVAARGASSDHPGTSTIGTIYFGGGTPSLLDPADLNIILEKSRHLFDVQPGAEITLEANPDDMMDRERLKAWRSAGINRLSIGVQSFFDDDLQWMNRAHDAAQAAYSIRLAQEEGLDNISIDLIYGGPTLPDDRWEANVRRAFALEVPHLSCYALTVEPRTALDKMIRQHQRADVSPDDQARQLLQLMEWTAEAGYEHYEISNFARPGHRSRHNSAYWRGIPYLGLGPSAHSYDGRSREWNVANNALYIAALQKNQLPTQEKEVLTPTQQFNEYIMISLRTMEGCDLQHINRQFGKEAVQEVSRKIEPYVSAGAAVLTADRVCLTPQGKLLADRIAADLFYDVFSRANKSDI